ncbi:hypothetical protein [Paenibacillus sp. XY044]|uniref:hypothetical protein n=1 Tax=Paenibacillus sp. XY044 TaxID=2026089 RepID=UPI000B99BA0B|nr:hypothetical protein [Paenibacillus sp. XY044]OZB98107.1 hypothetical protein CJP46_02765 [Paenibacillus sp. XY044]
MLKEWIQANLTIFSAILIIKLICWANPDLDEPFNYWWGMLIPNVAFILVLILKRFFKEEFH